MQHDTSPEISPPVEPEEAKPQSGGWTIFLDPYAWLMFGLALGLDQLTKWLVTSNMVRSQSIPEEGFFRITYVWNTGSAFGLFTGHGEALTIVSLVAVGLARILLPACGPGISDCQGGDRHATWRRVGEHS